MLILPHVPVPVRLLVASVLLLNPACTGGSEVSSSDTSTAGPDVCSEKPPVESIAFAEVTAPAPPPRWGHVAGFDVKRDRMLVFGGTNADGKRSDVWQFTDTWTEIPSINGPSGRYTSGGVMDPERDRWIVMSGDDGVPRDDVWALALETDTWTELAKGPPARFDVFYANAGRRAWFFAGFAEGFIPLDDLWEMDLDQDTWRELPTGESRPSKRTNGALAHHEGFLYVIGGHDDNALTPDVWRYELAGEQWEPVPTPTELDAWAHFSYARGPGAELWMFGGDNDDYVEVATTWRVTLGSPIEITEIAPRPETATVPARRHSTLVLGPKLILYGGALGRKEVLGDTRIGTVEPAPPCEGAER